MSLGQRYDELQKQFNILIFIVDQSMEGGYQIDSSF
jgi:hypothetical protein